MSCISLSNDKRLSFDCEQWNVMDAFARRCGIQNPDEDFQDFGLNSNGNFNSGISAITKIDSENCVEDGIEPGNFPDIGSPPPVEVKLFVGRVPRTFDENMLRPIFAEYGKVGDVIIIRDRETGAHKGCAFVRMNSITKADLCIREINNVKILDQALGPIQVKYAQGEVERLGFPGDNGSAGHDQAKLFVGSLPKNCTENDIRRLFERFGTLDEVFIMKDDNKAGRSGCAFVKFSYKEAAFHAIANLNGKCTMRGSSRAMEVRFAENKKSQHQQQLLALRNRIGKTHNEWTEYFTSDGRPYYYHSITGTTQWDRPTEMDQIHNQTFNWSASSKCNGRMQDSTNVANGIYGLGVQAHGPPGANIFVFHIPNEWTESDLLSEFGVYGDIVSARIAADKLTGRNRGFGFVSYVNVRSAVKAVQSMNGYSVSGKRLKVQIKKGEEHYAEAYTSHQRSTKGSIGVFNGASSNGSINALSSIINNNQSISDLLSSNSIEVPQSDPSDNSAILQQSAVKLLNMINTNSSGLYGDASSSLSHQPALFSSQLYPDVNQQNFRLPRSLN